MNIFVILTKLILFLCFSDKVVKTIVNNNSLRNDTNDTMINDTSMPSCMCEDLPTHLAIEILHSDISYDGRYFIHGIVAR